MKLVSMLCLILGTACISDSDAPSDRRTGEAIEPNAPDLEAIDQPDLEPNAPDLVGAGQAAPSREPSACLVDDDCAADEACERWTCTRIRGIPDERPF